MSNPKVLETPLEAQVSRLDEVVLQAWRCNIWPGPDPSVISEYVAVLRGRGLAADVQAGDVLTVAARRYRVARAWPARWCGLVNVTELIVEEE